MASFKFLTLQMTWAYMVSYAMDMYLMCMIHGPMGTQEGQDNPLGKIMVHYMDGRWHGYA